MSAKAERPAFTEVLKAEWSHHSNICAGIGNDFRVHFLGAGTTDQIFPYISRGQRALVIQWSPLSDLLAIGWSDGCITVFDNGKIIDSKEHQKVPVTNITWHPLKNRFVSVNKNGLINIWSYENNSVSLRYSLETQNTYAQLIYSPEQNDAIIGISTEGEVYEYVEGEDSLKQLYQLPKPVKFNQMLFDSNTMLSVSGDNILTIYSTKPNFTKKNQIKLESGDNLQFTDVSDDVICYSVNDKIYLSGLNFSAPTCITPYEKDNIIGIQYYSDTSSLACMTASGHVIIWKVDIEKKAFSIQRNLESNLKISKAVWSPYVQDVIIIMKDKSYVVYQIPQIRVINNKDLSVVQIDSKGICITGQLRKKFDFTIEKICSSASNLLVASRKTANVMSMSYGSLNSISEFEIPGPNVEILGDTVYVAYKNVLEVRNKYGETRGTIQLNTESSVMKTAINGRFLCLLTDSMDLFLFDVSKRTPNLMSMSHIGIAEHPNHIKTLSISRGGFAVSVSISMMDKGRWVIAPCLYLHSPSTQKTIEMKLENPPLAHEWDTVSERVLCIQTAASITPLVVSADLQTQPLRARPSSPDRLMFKVESPRVLCCTTAFRHQVSVDAAVTSLMIPQLLPLDGLSGQTRRILINVLYAISTGNRASAESMISNINDEPTARSTIRFLLSMNEKELCAPLLELLTESTTEGETDKLNFLDSLSPSTYDDADTVCAPTDKMCSKASAYVRGLNAESSGDNVSALLYFAQAGPNAPEVLKQAVRSGDLSVIFKAANDGNSDPMLHLWLGRFYEYKEQFDTALTHYDLCGDVRESIRLLCLIGQYDEATKRVADTEQRGVICEYARLLVQRLPSIPNERQDAAKRQILELFKRAKQYGPAFEFAYKNGLKEEAFSLSLSAPRTLLAKAAMQFERDGDLPSAVLLYNRAGRLNRALALCLDNDIDSALEEIADTISGTGDPHVLERCAEYFVKKQRWIRAACFYARALNFDKALEICDEYEVSIDRGLLDQLASDEYEPEVTKKVARLCEQQGHFITAAHIYTTLNDPISAMRNIIKDGDAEKVIRSANHLKRKDAFIMAADFLASTEPRDDQQDFVTVIQFYQRAGAYDRISEFLEKSAQTEIDDFSNYPKALELLRKSHQTMAKADITPEREAIVESQLQKIRWIEMYIEAAQCVSTDPLRMQSLCNELLQTPGIEECLRVEDVYILLVKYFVSGENYQQAYRILENMRMNGVDLACFKKEVDIPHIYRAVGQFYVEEQENPETEKVDDIPDDVVDAVEDDF